MMGFRHEKTARGQQIVTFDKGQLTITFELDGAGGNEGAASIRLKKKRARELASALTEWAEKRPKKDDDLEEKKPALTDESKAAKKRKKDKKPKTKSDAPAEGDDVRKFEDGSRLG